MIVILVYISCAFCCSNCACFLLRYRVSKHIFIFKEATAKNGNNFQVKVDGAVIEMGLTDTQNTIKMGVQVVNRGSRFG